MLLKDLFERDNVEYPDWLSEDYLLDDEWGDAIYFKSDTIHKWELNSIMGLSIITLENKVCTFDSYNLDNELIFKKVDTPEYEIIT